MIILYGVDGLKFPFFLLANLIIYCADPESKELIKEILSTGHVSHEVSVCPHFFSNCLPKALLLYAFPISDNHANNQTILQVRFLDVWEPAVLALKREGYSIKCDGQRDVVITEKFQPSMIVWFPKLLSFTVFVLFSKKAVCDAQLFK
jgi:hypothetical protein